jgi:hypothetical protein
LRKVDQKVRRFALRPLTRRTQDAFDPTTYFEALRRLEERVAGEDVLRQALGVQPATKSGTRTRDWKNPKRAAQEVTLARALYASRRISLQEYVFFATFPVNGVHEGRWLDGHYEADLGPVRQAISEIERKQGLGPEMYWPRGEGPVEHAQLNRRYEAILDEKFIETLREFGLDDLADLIMRSPAEFDRLRERGRRSVFHRDEYILAVQDTVLQYEQEARQAASVTAYSAAVTSLGAGLEGLLLLRCLRSPIKAGRLSKALRKRIRPRSSDDPTTWTFETLIEVCMSAGWLPAIETSIARYDTAGLAHVLRFARNYVHPGKRARQRPWIETDEREYQDTHAIYIILLSTLGKVRRNRRLVQPELTLRDEQRDELGAQT